MNKIISTAIFYGSALIIGGIIGASAMPKQPATPQRSGQLESQVEETKEQDNSRVAEVKSEPLTIKSKEETTKKAEKPQEQPVASVEKKAAPKNTTVTPASTAPKTGTVISAGEDYYESIMGLCPSQRDKKAEWEDGSRLVSIGLTVGNYDKNGRLTLEQLIRSNWNYYKVHGPILGNKYMMASLNNVSSFDNTWSNSRIGFFIDFDGLFVTWDNSWEDNKTINATDEQMRYLDNLVSDGTNYLRWLDSTYNAKCPND